MFNTINSLVSQAIESPDFYSGGTSTPSRNVLSGNIMAGASWNSTNTALQEALTKATGQPTQNFAVPGSTTSDTLKQLNDFIGGGGSFAPGATVFLQAGGVDFLNGVDKGTIKDNLNNIVSTLGNSGVKVVMTGSPYATSVADVENNNFNPEVDPIYKEVASANKNVALVDTMGNILQNKSLLKDALHTNEAGTAQYNADVLGALASMNSSQIGSEKISANAQPDQLLNAAQTSSVTPTMSTAQAISAANQYAQANNVDITGNINKWIDANPGASAAQVNAEMAKYGVSQADVAKAIAQRSDLDPNAPKLIGDTYYQPTFQGSGSGMDYQQGALSDLLAYTQGENKVGGAYNQYDAQGNLVRQGTQQAVSNSLTPFVLGSLGLFGGLGGGLESLLGGGGAAAGTGAGSAFELANAGAGAFGGGAATTIAGTGMTLSELAQLDLALGGAGGTTGALEMASTIGGTGAATAAAQVINATELATTQTIGNTGMTMSELSQLDLSLGGTGGTAGAIEMANTIGGTTAAVAATEVANAMGGGTGLTTTGNTALSSMGGGTGLLPSTAANLEALGGAQGLTTAAAGGGILGATGVNTGLGVLGASTLGSTLAGLNTGVTGGLGGTDVIGMGTGTGVTTGNSGLGIRPDTAGLGAEGLGAGITAADGLTGTGILTGSSLGESLLGSSALNNLTGTGILAGSTLGTGLLGTGTGAGLTGTGVLTGSDLGTTLLGTGAGSGITGGVTGLGGDVLGTGALTTGVGSGGGLGGVVGAGTGNLITSGGVTGMGTGTGLTTGAAGLGLNAGTAGLGAEGLGAGLSAAGTGLGAGLGSTLGSLSTGVGAGLGAAAGAGLGAGLGSSVGSGLGAGVGSGLGAGLGSNLAGVTTGVGSGLASGLASGAGSALGTTLGTGLAASALGTGLGGLVNQQGIAEARDLINQYGTRAGTQLADAYKNAQALNAANRADIGNVYSNTTGNLQNLYNQQVGYQQPYQQVGQAGSQGLIANQPYFTKQFDVNDLNSNLAPNYAFMLAQGQMANQRAGNMGGGALGGNALQGLQKYTQDYAGNAYQQAFNNYNTQRNNIYNTLSGMANIGTTSAGQLAGLGNTYGSNMGSLASNYGGNLTTSYGQGIGAANAYGLNQANLATGIGSALASNATQSGANTASMLSNLGNTALLGSMIKAT